MVLLVGARRPCSTGYTVSLAEETFTQHGGKDVVVMGMDEATFKQLREPFALWHPHLGKFLQAMALAKPSVLGLGSFYQTVLSNLSI